MVGEKTLQRFTLWLIPEDVKKGCGWGAASTDNDPFLESCTGHDLYFDVHLGPVVRGDRAFFASMLHVCANEAEKSINRGLWLIARCLVYLFFVRTVGVLLFWRLSAKEK